MSEQLRFDAILQRALQYRTMWQPNLTWIEPTVLATLSYIGSKVRDENWLELFAQTYQLLTNYLD